MNKTMVFLILLCISASAYAQDFTTIQKQKDRARATYWAQQGYRFDPNHMTAYSMDQKVKDIERAKYWKQHGYTFDPNHMTAYSMDQKVKDTERAKYWKQQGYTFDPNHMTAYSMDQKVKDIERAKYWKQQGYTFDPNHMTAYSMDQAVAEHSDNPRLPKAPLAQRSLPKTSPSFSNVEPNPDDRQRGRTIRVRPDYLGGYRATDADGNTARIKTDSLGGSSLSRSGGSTVFRSDGEQTPMRLEPAAFISETPRPLSLSFYYPQVRGVLGRFSLFEDLDVCGDKLVDCLS